MWPVILQFLRVNLPYIALPFAAVVGFVGFSMESRLRSSERLSSVDALPKKTFKQARLERRLDESVEEVPDWEKASSTPTLEYRASPMFDKNK
ncbi:unnamed protein product [Schistocephalus solidus]|uniref:Small integral membrane protein 12 n=1 Tax=Schistocephalus solidus TaxID=70667 RepID=A0A183TD30_SCHSO|nr:unnamed protein product [Schistocephalus solidus]